MAWNKPQQAGTNHSDDCRMAFGRKDPNCPRCQELIAGANPRKWASNSNQDEQFRILAIRNHDCKASGCGPVCVRFDW